MPARSSDYDTTSASGSLRAIFAASRKARSPMASAGSSGQPKRKNAETALDRHYGLRRRLYVRIGSRFGVQSVYLKLTPTALEHT